MAYNEFTETPEFVTTGDSFRIQHKITERFLSVNEESIGEGNP